MIQGSIEQCKLLQIENGCVIALLQCLRSLFRVYWAFTFIEMTFNIINAETYFRFRASYDQDLASGWSAVQYV